MTACSRPRLLRPRLLRPPRRRAAAVRQSRRPSDESGTLRAARVARNISACPAFKVTEPAFRAEGNG